jgi:hypothetical protein
MTARPTVFAKGEKGEVRKSNEERRGFAFLRRVLVLEGARRGGDAAAWHDATRAPGEQPA